MDYVERKEPVIVVECVCGEDWAVQKKLMNDGGFRCTNPKCGRTYSAALLLKLERKDIVRRDVLEKKVAQ